METCISKIGPHITKSDSNRCIEAVATATCTLQKAIAIAACRDRSGSNRYIGEGSDRNRYDGTMGSGSNRSYMGSGSNRSQSLEAVATAHIWGGERSQSLARGPKGSGRNRYMEMGPMGSMVAYFPSYLYALCSRSLRARAQPLNARTRATFTSTWARQCLAALQLKAT